MRNDIYRSNDESDQDEFEVLLKRFGVVYTKNKSGHTSKDGGGCTIEIDASWKGKQVGYKGFMNIITFDQDGTFENWGIYE
jgi:hypothetical protein